MTKLFQHNPVTGWFSGELRRRPLEDEQRRLAAQLRLYQELNAPVLLYAETTDTVQNRIDRPVSDRPIMPDEEVDVAHVLRVIAAHHLGKNQIERRRPE